jgi:GxxExxY protein
VTAELIEEELTEAVIGVFYDVYNSLGYGFLEHVYMLAMERELTRLGHSVAREYPAPVYFKTEVLCTYRIDIVVDEKVIVEIKSTEQLHSSASRQLRNYLKATEIEVGLLFHFGPDPKYYRQVLSNQNKLRNRELQRSGGTVAANGGTANG